MFFQQILVLQVTLGALGFLWAWSRQRRVKRISQRLAEKEALFNPGILKDFSSTRDIETSNGKYKVRSFYRAHVHLERLPSLADLPLLVFIHGMGGSIAQFAPLLRSLSNIAPCFGIDLPGSGLSELVDDAAYSVQAFSELLEQSIKQVCMDNGHDKVVLICHSMGCSLGAQLAANQQLPLSGMIAICPKAAAPTDDEVRRLNKLLSFPDLLLDGLRWFDRYGGPDSRSVLRFTGKADLDLRKLQLQYNRAFSTPAFRKTVSIIPGFPARQVWSKVDVPLFLIGAEGDTVTPPDNVVKIASYLDSDVTSGKVEDNQSLHSAVVRTAILPKPASHVMFYDHSTYRTVAGLIEDFLAKHVSEELSLGWQLQHLTTTGKWDVKNLAKWEKVLPVSGPIGGGIFRALKTLREQDKVHTPAVFVPEWTGKIFAVVDISHETPIYNTSALDKGGIQYHKFPTVSKLPPTADEVQGFIALVDRLREEIKERYDDKEEHSIGVHCHYGKVVLKLLYGVDFCQAGIEQVTLSFAIWLKRLVILFKTHWTILLQRNLLESNMNISSMHCI